MEQKQATSNSQKLLLHICCAPDATIPWPELIAEGYAVTGYFYGSNIHPEEEYLKRLEALNCLREVVKAPVILPEYNPSEWFEKCEEFAAEPEGGKRCAECFRAQFEAGAKYAAENGFDAISTTLTISPHKNVELINKIGTEIAEKHKLLWLERIWRKNNGFKRSVEASRELGIYRQNYCGCIFSRHKGEADE